MRVIKSPIRSRPSHLKTNFGTFDQCLKPQKGFKTEWPVMHQITLEHLQPWENSLPKHRNTKSVTCVTKRWKKTYKHWRLSPKWQIKLKVLNKMSFIFKCTKMDKNKNYLSYHIKGKKIHTPNSLKTL